MKTLLSQTFLGASESPRPNKGSTEKPDITQDVMVSGAVFQNFAFPSDLKHIKHILKRQTFDVFMKCLLTNTKINIPETVT
jgi:hypothetical protein